MYNLAFSQNGHFIKKKSTKKIVFFNVPHVFN